MSRFSWERKFLIIVLSLFLALALSVMPMVKTGFCSPDPWYRDSSYHWAYHYIYVLWLEGVTDGQLSWWCDELRAYFFPDSVCTRAQFTVLMAKTFGLSPVRPDHLSYPDVPESYKMLPGKPAWEWIEAARLAGIAFTLPGERFYPDSGISRQDAVDLLIRSLDLYDYALSMSDEEVHSLLRRFGDGMKTSPNRRHSMACAIKLGIIDGYEDWTIRPNHSLWRCHAATIVCRSCLIRATANLNAFSPDGDGIDDEVIFSLSYLKNRGISTWNMAIEDSSGATVYTFNPQGRSGSPPYTLSWDGTNSRGHIVAPGRYYYQAWVKDRSNRMFFSVKKPLDVIRYSLSGYLYPESCIDGQTLTVVAFTNPSATNVTGRFADGKSRNFHPSENNRTWAIELVVGSFLPLGRQEVCVTGEFEGVRKNMIRSFTRLENLWITPSVFPNPARPGQALDLYCESSSNVDSVTVHLFETSVALTKTGTDWEGIASIPAEALEGLYPVVFTGRSKNREVNATIYLQVDTLKITDLVFTLTR
jgi:hypothetical protein